MEFERVFYKNDFAAGAAWLNLYMICKLNPTLHISPSAFELTSVLVGGTNWGNLGYPGEYGRSTGSTNTLTRLGIYTSYDYGAAITENRQVYREKYSELKLEANFLKVSPAYLTASVEPTVNGTYASNDAITVTPLFGNGTVTNFYIVRHADFQQKMSATYTLNLNTSQGTLSIPQLGGTLTLSGRDSKWHVTDYDLGGTTLLYSTAEIFTWKTFDSASVLVVYGGPGELHELAVITKSSASMVEGTGVTSKSSRGSTILNWQTSPTRRVVQVGNLFVYILDRNSAYNYWVPDFVRDDEWGA